MGAIMSVLNKMGCFSPTWEHICENSSDDKLSRWMGSIPKDKDALMGMSKIKDPNYNQLLVDLAKEPTNIYNYDLVDEVIGKTRQKRPRLIRASKCLDITKFSMYSKLQFLSTTYPRISKLEHGHSVGYHGFTHMKKTKHVVFLCDTHLSNYKEVAIDKMNNKLKVFHHGKKDAEYKTISFDKYIAWDVGGITSVSKEQLENYERKTGFLVKPDDIETSAKRMLEENGTATKYNIWSLTKFMQSIIETRKQVPSEGLMFCYMKYNSTDQCLLIRNGNVPEMLTTYEQKQIYIDGLNSLAEFKTHKLTHEDVFGDVRGNHKIVEYYDLENFKTAWDSYKMEKLRTFYNEYSVVGNTKWCNSNINIKNLNNEYQIPLRYQYIKTIQMKYPSILDDEEPTAIPLNFEGVFKIE